MNTNFDRELFSNIDISEEYKKELFENCRKGKRAGDLRFRYSGVLCALIVTVIFGCTGAGSYAYYRSVQARMEAMPETEIHEYVLDLENDTGVTIDDSYSRKLTDEEALRVAELERKYNAEAAFPAEDVKRVEKLSDWDGKSVCYVEEDHKLHFPDTMTDEQLLSFIDYQTNKDYVMEKEAEKESDGTPSPYVDVENVSEDELVKIGEAALIKLFGEGDFLNWNTRITAFKPSSVDPEAGKSHDMYHVYWEQTGGSGYSTTYQVCLGMYDLRVIAAAVDGKEYVAQLKDYTEADALKKADADKEKVYAAIEALYGYKNPIREKHEICDDYGDASRIRYVVQYADTYVDVNWNLGEEKLSSVEFDEESYFFDFDPETGTFLGE